MAQRITTEDLATKFRNLQSEVQGTIEDKKQNLVTAAAVGGIVLLLIFFVLGKRSGKRKTTFVEIRRV